MSNYVKFMRGTPRAYELLSVKDDDTLYFISEKDGTSGKLYLGEKELICDAAGSTIAYLRDLIDVNLPENVANLIDGQVLTYDVASESWMAKDPTTIVNVLFDSNQFEIGPNGEWSLLNFANAPSGARLTKSATGELIWDVPDDATNEELAEQVEVLRTNVDSLTTKFNAYDTSAQVDTKISQAIAAANHLSYQTVNTVEDIDLTQDQYIYLVKNGEVYDEYMVINGQLEKVGDWNVDLSNYATKTDLQTIDTKVIDLTSELNGVKTNVETVTNNLANITTKVDNLENTSSQVTDLATSLNQMSSTVAAQAITIQEHTTQITTLQNALDNKVDQTEFNQLKSAMSWKSLSDVE